MRSVTSVSPVGAVVTTAIVAAVLAARCGSSTPPSPSPQPTAAGPSQPAPPPAPPPPPTPQCDPGLWAHVHDTQRLKIVNPCVTVTGVIVTSSSSDDGDIDMQLTVDPQYANLLNSGNLQKLHGNLQTEAICQAKVHNDVPDALRACANFAGSVPLPPLGTRVQVTGTYLLDQDHGWMEVHPISAMTW